jgi:hypothetical protein
MLHHGESAPVRPEESLPEEECTKRRDVVSFGRYVTNVAGRGYCFVAPIRRPEAKPPLE